MRKIRDFLCLAGHTTEDLVDDNVNKIKCLECGKPAKRILSAVVFHDTTPSAISTKLRKRSDAHALSKPAKEEAWAMYEKTKKKF